jgi:apolipoprotein N-acyltransferase
MTNLTNDGWFLDSSELDMHLAICGFRAVETRRPFARAANTGISSILDATGRAVHRLTRNGRDREIAGLLQAEVPLSNMRSLYVSIGDAFAGLISAAAAALLALALWRKPTQPSAPTAGPVK